MIIVGFHVVLYILVQHLSNSCYWIQALKLFALGGLIFLIKNHVHVTCLRCAFFSLLSCDVKRHIHDIKYFLELGKHFKHINFGEVLNKYCAYQSYKLKCEGGHTNLKRRDTFLVEML